MRTLVSGIPSTLVLPGISSVQNATSSAFSEGMQPIPLLVETWSLHDRRNLVLLFHLTSKRVSRILMRFRFRSAFMAVVAYRCEALVTIRPGRATLDPSSRMHRPPDSP